MNQYRNSNSIIILRKNIQNSFNKMCTSISLRVWKFEKTVWIILTVLWSIFSLSFAFSHYTCIGMHLPMHINLTTRRWMDKKGRSRRVDARNLERSNWRCTYFYSASILVSRTNQISRAIKNWNKTFLFL